MFTPYTKNEIPSHGFSRLRIIYKKLFFHLTSLINSLRPNFSFVLEGLQNYTFKYIPLKFFRFSPGGKGFLLNLLPKTSPQTHPQGKSVPCLSGELILVLLLLRYTHCVSHGHFRKSISTTLFSLKVRRPIYHHVKRFSRLHLNPHTPPSLHVFHKSKLMFICINNTTNYLNLDLVNMESIYH